MGNLKSLSLKIEMENNGEKINPEGIVNVDGNINLNGGNVDGNIHLNGGKLLVNGNLEFERNEKVPENKIIKDIIRTYSLL
jgi:hypothetical protein